MEKDLCLQVEALIFASTQPLSLLEIVDYLSQYHQKDIKGEIVSNCISNLYQKYNQEEYAFELKESGGGYQFLSKKRFHPIILLLNGDKFIKKLSPAAMETLSIIAYKQPVTKLEIENIRGVNSDYSVQRLLEKELVYIIGRQEDAIGKPLLYGTTKQFMEYLGINHPEELPKMKEILAITAVEPNDAKEAMPEEKEVVHDGNVEVSTIDSI